MCCPTHDLHTSSGQGGYGESGVHSSLVNMLLFPWFQCKIFAWNLLKLEATTDIVDLSPTNKARSPRFFLPQFTLLHQHVI